MTTKYFCKNFNKENLICQLCVINKTYVDVQNADCKSCFSPDLNNIKPV